MTQSNKPTTEAPATDELTENDVLLPDENVLDAILRVMDAWERLRPHKKFAGMSLEDFKKAVQPCIDAHAECALPAWSDRAHGTRDR